jgi:polyisoprenoid-binding protein YceI
MRTRTPVAILALTLVAVATLIAPHVATEVTAAPEGETFKIDPVHTSVHFRVKHMSASMFQGRFNESSGSVTWNEADLTKSAVKIEVKAGSVDSRTERLDGHIKSPDFLNAAQFPVISFVSKSWKKVGTGTWDVFGDFTLRGVKKEITIRAEHIGTSEIRGKRIGFSTTITINRRDYQVNYGADEMVGDQVTLVIDVEAVKE